MGLKNKIRKILSMLIPQALVAGLLKTRILYGLFHKLPPNHYQFDDPTYKTVKRFGVRLRLNLHDYMGWHTYYNLEDSVVSTFLREIREGDVVYDIGGNIGFMTLLAARLAGNKGYVYTFEPNPGVLHEMEKNIELNHFKNISVVRNAVGAVKETMKLNIIDPHNLGRSTLSKSPSEAVQQIPVEVIRLDDFCEAHGIRPPDVIKIDIEGFEYEALKGATNIIDRFRPRIIMEVNREALQENGIAPAVLLHFLENMGYVLYDTAKPGIKITAENELQGHSNILAIYQPAKPGIGQNRTDR